MNEEILITKAFQFGLPTVILFILLYVGVKLIKQVREDGRKDYEGVTNRLNQVEDFQKEKLVETIDKNTVALVETKYAIVEFRNTIAKCKGSN